MKQETIEKSEKDEDSTEQSEAENALVERLKINLKQEKTKMKSLEEQLENLKEENLKVKKEKHELKSTLKNHEQIFKDYEKEGVKYNKVISDLEDKIKKNEKLMVVKDVQQNDLVKENNELNTRFDNLQLELKDLRKETYLNTIRSESQHKCDRCDEQFHNKVDLSLHVRMTHSRDQVCQTIFANTETIIKSEIYSCFYCHQHIRSKDNLKHHLEECREL